MAKRRRRVYRMSDLEEIARQLGGRLNIQILPIELLRPEPPKKETTDARNTTDDKRGKKASR